MNYSDAPPSVRVLEQRLREAEGAVKGGSAMALRYGRNTRFTKDFDAARASPLEEFRDDFESSLVRGWGGFTGRLVQKAAPRPAGVPPVDVMQPVEVKLSYWTILVHGDVRIGAQRDRGRGRAPVRPGP